MSVDMALASPTSTVSVASTPSAWDRLRLQLNADWAVKVAAAQRQEPAAPTAAELRTRLAQYNGWLDTPYVQNHGALADWVKQQKANVLRQLADITVGGAK